MLLADLGDPSAGWRLRPDTGHPALFDHGSDHIPGMVLVEAFRQAALVRVGQDTPDTPGVWAIHSMQTSFLSFGELGQPVTVAAEPDGPGAHRLAARQGPRTLATALVAGGTTSPLGSLMAGAGAAAC